MQILILLILASISLGNQLKFCKSVATTHFMTTCSQGPNSPAQSIEHMKGEKVQCQNSHSCLKSAAKRKTCSFQRKLCVSCRVDELTHRTIMRIQSNGLPHYCWGSYTAPHAQDIDFEVIFNSQSFTNHYNTRIAGKLEINQKICTPLSLKNYNIPAEAQFYNYGKNPLNMLSGIAINGVAIYPAVDLNNEDVFNQFYSPAASSSETLDTCLGEVVSGKIYVYRTNSPCLYKKSISEVPKLCSRSNHCKFKKIMMQATKVIAIIGLSKDGHLMLGPYADGHVWSRKGIDVCNGVIISKSVSSVLSYSPHRLYVYVSTSKFPYISGCFGRGNFPDSLPGCSRASPNGYFAKS